MGHTNEIRKINTKGKDTNSEDFVLEKGIFNIVFEKDIRRVFIYKKAERLAKAIHLITPAFVESASLRNRIDAIAIGLVDAAILSPGTARAALSRELLTLSSILSIARTGGFLSAMNVELIAREAHMLLQEIAAYEEPRLSLDESPTFSGLVKKALSQEVSEHSLPQRMQGVSKSAPESRPVSKRHITDINIKDRREAVLAVIKDKKKVSIKDISTRIRGVSEKTIQRELQALISLGMVSKEGERRWSTYELAH